MWGLLSRGGEWGTRWDKFIFLTTPPKILIVIIWILALRILLTAHRPCQLLSEAQFNATPFVYLRENWGNAEGGAGLLQLRTGCDKRCFQVRCC